MDTVNFVGTQPRPQAPAAKASSSVPAGETSSPVTPATMGRDVFIPSGKKPEAKQPAPKTMQDRVADTILYREYGKGFNFQPITGTLTDLDFHVRPIEPNEAILMSDPNRAHAIAEMAEQGRSTTWAELRGAIRVNTGIGASTPTAPANLHVGSWANGEIGVSVLAPYDNGWAALKEAGKDVTVDLPFSAEKASKLVEGSEVVLRGRGRLGVGTGIGYNSPGAALPGGFGVGVSANVDKSFYTDKEINVAIKRLDGTKVHVTLSRIDTTGSDLVAGAQAGVTGSFKDKMPAPTNIVSKLAENRVDGLLHDWLRASAIAVYSHSESERDVKAYVLDLSVPEAAEAYERLLRLDTQPADALTALADGSAKKATLQESSESWRTGGEAKFTKVSLFSDFTSTTTAAGKMESPQGVFDYRLSAVARNHDDLLTRWWTGRVNTTREFIETSGNEKKLPGSLYHVRYDASIDGSTSAETMQRFLTTAGYLIGKDRVNQALANDPALLNRFWRSQMTMDVAFKKEGIQRLMQASEAELQVAYAQAYEELDHPKPRTGLFGETIKAWKVTPWLNKSDKDYAEVMDLLKEGPGAIDGSDMSQPNTDRYFQITGRNLGEDADAHKESQRLVALVRSLAQAPTSAARANILTKAQGFELNPLRELVMITKVAGQDSVVVKELAIRDRSSGKDLVFNAFGTVGDPREEIAQGLAMSR